jgi:N-acetylneuraminic acid mutarotase
MGITCSIYSKSVMKINLRLKLFIVIAAALIAGCKDKGTDSKEEETFKLNWEEMKNFPGCIRIEAAGFWIGEKFYTGLGFGYLDDNFQNLDNLNDFYEYDTSTKTWTRKADFPGIGRMKAASFSIGEKGYIGFGQSLVNCDQGCDQVAYRDLWEYDPIQDRWETAGTYDQVEEGATIYSKSFPVNGKVYITLGFDLWAFDPSDKSLVKTGSLPENLILISGFVLNNRIYLGTGSTPSIVSTFYEFDPATLTWTKKAEFPGPIRRFASGFAYKGKGYLSCGQGVKELSPGSYQYIGLTDTWQYDPNADSWTKINDYPGAAFIHQVCSDSESKVAIGTGETGIDILYGKDFWMLQ